MSKIRIIKNEDIDTVLWDRCIARAKNGDIFGYSWFLDAVNHKWQGIVLGNYKAVMPLPVNYFLGFALIKNYKFQSKTDIYSREELSEEIKVEFLLTAKTVSNFIHLSTENKFFSDFSSKSKTYYSWKLDLIRPYKILNDNYNDYVIRQLNSSESENVFFNTGILPNGIILLSSLTKTLKRKDIDTLRRLAAVSLRKNLGQIYGAFNDKNRLIAAVLFISSHFKVNIIHAVQTKEAQSKKALYGLIDFYIKKHSERALTLDFFGLDHLSNHFYENSEIIKYPWYQIRL